MYICLCNCIKEKQVHSALAEGVCSVGDVFRKLGCAPMCGKCVPELSDALQDVRALTITE